MPFCQFCKCGWKPGRPALIAPPPRDGSTAAIPIPCYGVATLTIPVSALAACICPVLPERQDDQYIHKEAINVMMQQSEQGVQSVEHT
jgi:hypothetical protein